MLLDWIAENAVVLGGIAAIAAIAQFTLKPFRRIFAKREIGAPGPDPMQLTRFQKPREVLDVEAFLRTQQKLRDELKAELEDAHTEDRARLQAQIDELSRRIADPEPALKEAQKRIVDLEALLAREGDGIGAERLEEARALLEAGDYSLADDIFAEIEAREQLAVERAARAAFGRGEVAEAEVRWRDAADHFAKAARLDPNYDTLLKAGTYSQRSGRYNEAVLHKEALVNLARRNFGEGDEKTATALNNLAESYRAMGRYGEAEPLYREAQTITKAALGEDHPDYAIRLNNLAGLLKDTGRLAEAEPLYREAQSITKAALGEDHPDYATSLNNLAGLLQATGRLAEAEPFYREAHAITKAALGEEHPTYAIRLNNLAELLRTTGRLSEAEPLFQEAHAITKAALGEDHPDYAAALNNLALLLKDTGRLAKAEPLYREAQAITKARLGADHPDYAIDLNNLAELLRANGRDDEAEPMYREALEILNSTLGPDHPNTKTVQGNFDILLASRL